MSGFSQKDELTYEKGGDETLARPQDSEVFWIL